MLFVALLAMGAGVAVWNTTSNDRIDLVEDETIIDLRIDPSFLVTVNGRTLYVAERTTGSGPVILLHDADVAGSVTLDEVVTAVGADRSVVTIDLPGFGLSQRIPEPGSPHTVAQMARDIAAVIETEFQSAILMGVGLGGEVAAEVAATRPELVDGLVLIDVDFWRSDSWRERSQRLPFISKAMTFHYETSGRSALASWSPYCDQGGWCPTADQAARRNITASLENSTASINGFRNTPRSSFVPDDLDQIVAPTVYVWSTNGAVPKTSIDRISAAIDGMTVIEVAVFQAHLEAAVLVAEALDRIAD